jgi:hypothetical protein
MAAAPFRTKTSQPAIVRSKDIQVSRTICTDSRVSSCGQVEIKGSRRERRASSGAHHAFIPDFSNINSMLLTRHLRGLCATASGHRSKLAKFPSNGAELQ